MIISDKIYIKTSELGKNLQNLCELFIYSNPKYYQLKRLKVSVKNIPEQLYNYKIMPINGEQTLVLPRGAKDKVFNFFNDQNIPFRYLDKTIKHEQIDIRLKNTTILEEQQYNLINTLTKEMSGLYVLPCGGGKTIAALGLIAELKQPSLIIVHEHRLRSQWFNEIKDRLEGNFTLGRMDGDKKIDGDVVIGLVQTLYNIMDTTPEYFDKFGFIIVDECHRVPTKTFLNVLNNTKAHYRYGITATPERKDGMHIILYDVIGKILGQLKESAIKHRITDFEYTFINTNIDIELPTKTRWVHGKPQDVLDITKAITILTEDNDRNNIILSNVIKDIKDGYLPIIMGDRVDHNKYLYYKLKDLGYNVVLLIGETRKKIKWEEVREDLTIDCIVANTAICAEGLDIPRASSEHLIIPSNNIPKLTQKIGRIRRHVDGKLKPKVYDYVDNRAYMVTDSGRVNVFSTMRKKRLEHYNYLLNEYYKEAANKDVVYETK